MKLIAIDCGHGRSIIGTADNGACRTFGGHLYRERDFAKEIVKRMEILLKSKPELKDCLIQTVGLQSDTTPAKKMSFINTVIRENKLKPSECLSISIHMNASVFSNASGFEVWYQKKAGKALTLAQDVVESWKEYDIVQLRPRPIMSTGLNSKWHRLYIDDAICPAVLVETAFISNYKDMKAILDQFDRVAEAICHGVLTYIRNQK